MDDTERERLLKQMMQLTDIISGLTEVIVQLAGFIEKEMDKRTKGEQQ